MGKIRITLLVTFIIFIDADLCCQPKNDLARLNLKGKIKSVTTSAALKISSSPSESGFFTKKIKSANRTEFDEGGNVSQILISGKRGTVIEKYTFSYNDSGYKTKGFLYNSNDVLNYTYAFKFDKSGNMTEQYSYNSNDSLVSKNIFEYDNAGRMVTSYHYSSKDSLKGKRSFFYDKDTLTQTHEYSEGMRLRLKYRYMYEDHDQAGNWLKQNIYLVNSKAFEYVYRKIEYY